MVVCLSDFFSWMAAIRLKCQVTTSHLRCWHPLDQLPPCVLPHPPYPGQHCLQSQRPLPPPLMELQTPLHPPVSVLSANKLHWQYWYVAWNSMYCINITLQWLSERNMLPIIVYIYILNDKLWEIIRKITHVVYCN